MKKYIYTTLASVVALILVSCESVEKKDAVENEVPILVKVSEVSENSYNPFLAVSGKIQSVNSADLSTRMMGFVSKVYVNVGDEVKKGQLLIAINNADLQAKRAQVNAGIIEATAAFNNAQKDYNRFNNLFADSSASQKELDDMTTRYEMAKARLEAANQMKNEINAQFVYSNITAPFNGLITGKSVKEGDMASPGMALISIENPGNFEVEALVPESEISRIKLNSRVDVVVKSIHTTIKGTVSEVSTSAKNTGGQYLVIIALDRTEVNVLSGMFATIQFMVERKTDEDVVLIPVTSIITKGQLKGLYTVSKNNTALLRWLRLGRNYGDQVEVLSGLSSKEPYIISAEGKLFNGAKIEIQ